MKIVYNPKHGAPITKYIFFGTKIDPHYPDGYETEDKKYNGLVQYEDDLADAICETFTFLESLTTEQAQAILDRPADPEFVCDFPNCEFKSTHKIGLAGHKRSHKNGVAEKPAFDTAKIPVGGGQKVASVLSKNGNNDDKFGPELKSGIDADNVEWYGEGAVREKSGFSNIPEGGKGHFVG